MRNGFKDDRCYSVPDGRLRSHPHPPHDQGFRPDPVPAGMLDRVLQRALGAKPSSDATLALYDPRPRNPPPPGRPRRRFATRRPETRRPPSPNAQRSVRRRKENPGQAGDRRRRPSHWRSAQRQEDYAAIACAIQNIQLAACPKAGACNGSTGKITQLPETYSLLSVPSDKEEIVALLFFGYPASVPAAAPRKPLSEVARRLP